ncbi:putative RNA-binding Zn-ribbon protein involved in translation (DUF1610 family) [Croceifilum oryzae]|uniref:RNA-binding Zn-ribbon protein involved in translation (DUF1610 family) n=1 Tax=Croceifilum oryzae TaxID=1553429 RepID=A0AAJ1WT35_9BACL|nr:hypothetical protein [Croceifilum oryzae]MDQ0416591.1 putative RNA-binding Zn-ribbon protein involved in translation (DUF1610 family) [Croceifilum oryzae]
MPLTLYFSEVKCRDCGRIAIRKQFQCRKPQTEQTFMCPLCNEEKALYKYDRVTTVVDDYEIQRYTMNTKYHRNVCLIAVGTITISRFKRKLSS